MVELGQDHNGNYKARKRLPNDVREEYGRLYGQRVEAKFYAPASTPPHDAKRRFGDWLSQVEQRIEAIRKTKRGEGIDLDHKQSHALAGEWYSWFVARHEAEPGKPSTWDAAFFHLVDLMSEALPDDVQAEELERSAHVLTEWSAYPEVRAAMRPIVSDFGNTAQFLATKPDTLTNAARQQFLDAALKYLLPAVVLLERRAEGDYEPDDLPKSFPKFVRPEVDKSTGQTPIDLFREWVTASKPAHSTVESWSTVFNAMTTKFTGRSAGSISAEEAQAWVDSLVTSDQRVP